MVVDLSDVVFCNRDDLGENSPLCRIHLWKISGHLTSLNANSASQS